jgi:hypothetical protein
MAVPSQQGVLLTPTSRRFTDATYAGRSGNMTSWQMMTTLARHWTAIESHIASRFVNRSASGHSVDRCIAAITEVG